jgi:hypothetical protein
LTCRGNGGILISKEIKMWNRIFGGLVPPYGGLCAFPWESFRKALYKLAKENIQERSNDDSNKDWISDAKSKR